MSQDVLAVEQEVTEEMMLAPPSITDNVSGQPVRWEQLAHPTGKLKSSMKGPHRGKGRSTWANKAC